jgi:rhodanese-related sulfurtransferase
MNIEQYQDYLVPALIVGFFGYRFLKFKKVKSELPELLNKGAIVVDVRSAGEYQAGHRPGSLNIPVGELASRAKELDPSKTTILCCASGSRSGMAVGILKAKGFNTVINAGPWTNTMV